MVESGSVINYIVESGNGNSNDQLNNVLRGLGQRSTSHPENKELCLALMLRMDMAKITQTEEDLRTFRIVQQLPYIPRSFLWHEQPSLNVTGFSWLPGEILATEGGVLELGLKLTERGLLVPGEGLIFRARTHYLSGWAPRIRDVSTAKWYNFWWNEGESFTGDKFKSDKIWTVLAVLPSHQTMRNTIREAVVIRLDWELNSASPGELLARTAGEETISGAFVGRARLEEIDEVDTVYLKFKTAIKHDELEGWRQAVRRGEEDLGDASVAVKRLYKEEGDDSWYIFDGTHLR